MILNRQPAPTPQARALHEMLERQTRQLVRQVDDLLDVARITRGTFPMRCEPVEFEALVRRAAMDAQPAMEARAHRFEVHTSAEAVVKGDVARLSQVLTNLLDNATRYTEPGGRIQLVLSSEGTHAIARLGDSGRGIEPELLPLLFELFAQGARTADRSEGGLGIGLSVVKRIVELHGGTVEARSDGPGKGSEFVVRLPLASMPAFLTRAGGPT